MTNGEHSLWLGNALKSAPEIQKKLAISNAIEIAKALHDVPESEGGMPNDEYVKSLRKLLGMAGFTC